MIDNWDMTVLICQDVFERIFPDRPISDYMSGEFADDPELAQLYEDVSNSVLMSLCCHRILKFDADGD